MPSSSSLVELSKGNLRQLFNDLQIYERSLSGEITEDSVDRWHLKRNQAKRVEKQWCTWGHKLVYRDAHTGRTIAIAHQYYRTETAQPIDRPDPKWMEVEGTAYVCYRT